MSTRFTIGYWTFQKHMGTRLVFGFMYKFCTLFINKYTSTLLITRTTNTQVHYCSVNRKRRFENLSAYLMQTHICIFGPQGAVQMLLLLHFAWVVDDAKCIVVTRVCVSVCVCLCVCLSVCLSAAVRPHYCTDPDVTWERGRGCPLVVHY